MERVPCRVSSDLRQHQAAQELAERLTFDEFDEAHLAEILPQRLVGPVQALLIARRLINEPELDALYRACREEWEEA